MKVCLTRPDNGWHLDSFGGCCVGGCNVTKSSSGHAWHGRAFAPLAPGKLGLFESPLTEAAAATRLPRKRKNPGGGILRGKDVNRKNVGVWVSESATETNPAAW
jgi:hypothetical protein